jgi:UDP-N-acetyl-D-glucosamine dehydrogenase
MPKEVVNLTTEALNSIYKSVNRSNILIVGVSYKPNIDDVRESPALDIIELLRNMGAIVHYYDPLVPYLRDNIDLYSLSPQEVSSHQFDCGIIVANHNVIDYKFIKKSCKTIVDTRNVFTKDKDIFKL